MRLVDYPWRLGTPTAGCLVTWCTTFSGRIWSSSTSRSRLRRWTRGHTAEGADAERDDVPFREISRVESGSQQQGLLVGGSLLQLEFLTAESHDDELPIAVRRRGRRKADE